MARGNCLIMTPEIRDLASRFPDETADSVRNLIGLWQGNNNKGFDEMPTYNELKSFKDKLRGNDKGILNRTLDKSANEKMDSFFNGSLSKDNRFNAVEDEEYTIDKIIELYDKFDDGDTERRALANKVFDVAKKLNLTIRFTRKGEVGKFGGPIGLYKPYGNSIEFKYGFFNYDNPRNNIKSAILLHEVIHACTMYVVSEKTGDRVTGNLKEARDAFYEAYDLLKEEKDLADEYGITNVYEMVAELANAKFREKLKRINIWNRIRNAIRRLFFFDEKPASNAYQVLSRALNTVLDNFNKEQYDEYSFSKPEVDDGWDWGVPYMGNESRKSNGLVTKVISGGQTGGDTIGLQVAKELGIETGGTAPRGFRRENNNDNIKLSDFGLQEIDSEFERNWKQEHNKWDNYTARTYLNVQNSDGTVYFYTNSDSAGYRATKRYAEELGKPFLENPTADELKAWIKKHGIKTLNVAGNRGSRMSSDMANFARKALTEALGMPESTPSRGTRYSSAKEDDTGFEVSTSAGNELGRSFSAFNARFEKGTKILGEDVGGMTIEEVYQIVLKRNKRKPDGRLPKGQKPSKDSILWRPKEEDLMTSEGRVAASKLPLKDRMIDVRFIFGYSFSIYVKVDERYKNKINYIYIGYERESGWEFNIVPSDPNSEESVAAVNEINEILSENFIQTLYTLLGEDLVKDIESGLSVDKIRDKYGIYDFEQDGVANYREYSDEELEEISYAEYKKLWQVWAEQHTDLMQKLRNELERTGKTILTDKHARTRVSQARALAEILNETSNEFDVMGISGKTADFGVEVTSDSKEFRERKDSFMNEHPDGILAYRRNGDSPESFSIDAVNNGWIGNPFSTKDRGEDTVRKFYDWLVTGNNYGEPRATEEFRQAIIRKILDSSEDTSILYYTELGRPSHATVIGYLIRNKELLPSVESIDEAEDDEKRTIEEPVENEDAFNVEKINMAEEQRKVDLTFDAVTRRQRVSMIARLFIEEMDDALERAKADLFKRMNNEQDPSKKAQLKDTLDRMNRVMALRQYTPKALFKRILSGFKSYVDMSDDEAIRFELEEINKKKAASKYTEDKKLEAARKKALHKKQEYQKIIDCFPALAEEACLFLNRLENLRLNPDSEVPEIYDEDSDKTDEQGNDNEQDPEETPKDGWLINDWETSVLSSLSDRVRRLVMRIPILERKGNDKDGKPKYVYSKDDIYQKRYYDPSYVIAVLLERTMNMTRPEDLIPLLEQAAQTLPWIEQVIDKLQEDETMVTLLYMDLRKDFNKYWIQKDRVLPDGSTKNQTISLNKPEGIWWLLDQWRDNYQNAIMLDEDSIYDKEGKINDEKAEKGLELVKSLQDKLRNLSLPKQSEIIEENWETVVKLLHMVGINMDENMLKLALLTVPDTPGIKSYHPASMVLSELYSMFYSLRRGGSNVGNETENGRVDLINEWGGVYTNIAQVLSKAIDEVIESSVRENGKSYYSHVKPGYLDTLINELKNVADNDERFKQYIEEHFKQYDWFYDKKNGRWRNDWLDKLTQERGGGSWRELLDTKILLNANKVEMDRWDELEHMRVLLNEYWSPPNAKGRNVAWYHVPIMSNAPVAKFIKFVRYSGLDYDNDIIDKLADLVEQEYNRIMLVRRRSEARLRGESNLEEIANYDITYDSEGNIKSIGGAEFKFLPALNSLVVDDNGTLFLDRLEQMVMDKNQFNGNEIKEFIKNSLSTIMEDGFNKSMETWEKMGLLERTADGKRYMHLPFSSEKNMRDALREYYYNSVHATSQIIQLTATDLAFYKNLEEFQKRYKQIYSPGYKLNTLATWKGKRVGKDTEKTLTLHDNIVESELIPMLRNLLEEKVKRGELTKTEADGILSAYKKTNVTDAQAYRSPKSYREMMIMSGDWTDDMEQALENFRNGTWTMKDFDVIWQTKKPFLYSQIPKNDGFGGKLKVGVQHKNSEFLLLASLAIAPLYKDSKLAALCKYMEDNDIDVVQFESAVKTGIQGVMNLNDVSPENLKGYLDGMVYKEENGVRKMNDNVVHSVPYSDYMIQTPTPPHGVDAMVMLGTQIQKLITSDMPEDAEYDVNGKKLSKKEWIDTWNALMTENMLQAYKQCLKIFDSPEELEKALQKEIKGNPRYGREMVKACTLDKKTGKFNLPLSDPTQLQLQSLLQSIIKNRVTKKKVHGGAFILASSWGLSEDLHVVYETEGDKTRVKYIECYMPAYSRDFFEPLMGKDGTLDLNLLDKYCDKKTAEKLRRLIGWRTPTEQYYSMAPLRIKGFLPQQNGSAIMLPKEITTMAGSDFDVDKLFIFLHAFHKVEEVDWDAFRKLVLQNEGFRNWDKESGGNALRITIDEIRNGEIAFSDNTPEQHLFDYYQSVKKDIMRTRFKIEEYDWNKSMAENSREARENLMLDMMFSVLTNSASTEKLLSPGGFSENKRVSRIAVLLESLDMKGLKEMLVKEKLINGNETESQILDKFLNLDFDTLDRLAEQYKISYNPLDPTTQIKLHNDNFTGAALIGIYATHNPNHALMQQTQLEIKDEFKFTLNGKSLTSLHEVDPRISKVLASFVAASVDNVKDNTLAPLHQNEMTADVTMLLARLGYNVMEIGLLMNQPIVRKIVKTYLGNKRKGMSKSDAFERVIDEYKKHTLSPEVRGFTEKYKSMQFTVEWLAKNILISEEASALKDIHMASDSDVVSWYDNQVAVAYLFQRLVNIADDLSLIVQVSRYDTTKGAAGPTLADTEIKASKVNDLEDRADSPNFTLDNANVVHNILSVFRDGAPDPTPDELREKILKSPLPFMQASYTLGVESAMKLLGKYFPQFSFGFRHVINEIRNLTRSGRLDVKTMNNIYNDLMAYIMSSLPFFGAEDGMSIRDRRNMFINHFVDYFEKTVQDNPDIARLPFIKRLTRKKSGKYNPVDILVFRNVGMLDTATKEGFMRDWESLLYMENPEAQKLALNLIRYCYYRNGFAFGPNMFMHLAPVSVKKVIPGYVEKLEKMASELDLYKQFVGQYVRNHLNNRKIVPEIPQGGNVSFLDENKEIKDEVIFVINQNTPASDRKVIKKRTIKDGVTTYTFMDYIARREKGDIVYYKLFTSTDESALYTRIAPLGFTNSFIEYEYGADEVETVIRNEEKATYSKYDSAEAIYDDYDPSNDIDVEREQKEQVEEAAGDTLIDAVASYLGINTDPEPDSDMTNIEPNDSFKDDNNEEICKL